MIKDLKLNPDSETAVVASDNGNGLTVATVSSFLYIMFIELVMQMLTILQLQANKGIFYLHTFKTSYKSSYVQEEPAAAV